MLDRTTLLGLTAAAGLMVTGLAARCTAAAPEPGTRLVSFAAASDEDGKKGMDKDQAKGEHEDADDEAGEKKDKGKKKEKEIEQAVPMNMVPAAVVDAVMKECPGGKITEAELEAKKGKIMYGFDVKVGQMTYDVNISVEGKFVSKKVDDDGDNEADEKKPAMGEKK